MKKYDLIVVGGGFTGVAAAVSAAREGLSVLLAEKSNCLGGAASNSLVHPFMLYKTEINGKKVELCKGIFKEIGEKLNEKNKFQERGNDTFFHDEYLKLLLNRMVLDAGVEILYHAYLVDAKKEGDKIKSITVMGKGQKYELFADYFVDTTGDANLAAISGCPFRIGREKDSLCQPMTLCFRLANVDMEKFDPAAINVKYKQFKEEGKIKNPREDVLIFKTLMDGVLHFNTTRIIKLNPVDIFDVTKAEIEAREQVYEVYEFLKNNFEAFKDSEVIITAPEIGARESRLIDGDYMLTAQDLMDLKRFDDAIALGNYDMDIHNPEGSGTSHYFFNKGEYYTIPYRSLIPKTVSNLLVGGRCISADHEAQAAIRIMPIVCCIGHACGEAIAVASKSKTDVRSIDIKELQNKLVENGAALFVD